MTPVFFLVWHNKVSATKKKKITVRAHWWTEPTWASMFSLTCWFPAVSCQNVSSGRMFYFIVLLWLLNCDIMNISSIKKKLRTHKIIPMLNSGTGCHYLDFHTESRCGSNNSNVWTYCTLHDTRPCQPGPPSIWIWRHVFIYVTRARTHITSLLAKFPYTTLQVGTPSFMPYDQGKHGAFLHLLCLRRRVAINSCGA